FSVNVDAVNTKEFGWTSSLNLASNKNVILNLKGPEKYGVNADSSVYTFIDGPGTSGSSLQIFAVGGPLGQFYSYQYMGKNAAGKSLFLTAKGGSDTTPTAKTDYHPLGSPHPKLL